MIAAAEVDPYSELVCPGCGKNRLAKKDKSIVCGACGLSMPNLNGVPLLVPKSRLVDFGQILRVDQRIEGALSSELDDVFLAAALYGYKDTSLSAEFGNLRGRFACLKEAAKTAASAPVGLSEESVDAPLVAVTEMLATVLRPGAQVWRSLRVRNVSADTTFETVGSTPHHLSYHLYDEAGRLKNFEGPRSRFPIALAPGAELTVPMRIEAPEAPGRYRLDICSVQETVAWSQPIISVNLEVSASVKSPAITQGLIGSYDYPADFASAQETVRRALGSRGRVLEVACGMHPVSIAALTPESHLVATDLCYSELQLAKLHYRSRMSNPAQVFWLCSDIYELPLKDGAFDVIVICAALHHFPDPTAALKRLKRHLAPNGRFAIVREPCEVNPGHVDYINELLKGFNEQQFEIEEYAAMFNMAGLVIEEFKVDFGGSLKAILRAA